MEDIDSSQETSPWEKRDKYLLIWLHLYLTFFPNGYSSGLQHAPHLSVILGWEAKCHPANFHGSVKVWTHVSQILVHYSILSAAFTLWRDIKWPNQVDCPLPKVILACCSPRSSEQQQSFSFLYFVLTRRLSGTVRLRVSNWSTKVIHKTSRWVLTTRPHCLFNNLANVSVLEDNSNM